MVSFSNNPACWNATVIYDRNYSDEIDQQDYSLGGVAASGDIPGIKAGSRKILSIISRSKLKVEKF